MDIKTETYKGHKINIVQDSCPESPRDWDNICELHYCSDRYCLGDTHHSRIELFEIVKEAEHNKDVSLSC